MAELHQSSISLVVFLVFVFCSDVFSEDVDLGGRWTVNNANKSISLYGNVPGSVHMALLENGTIQDPYFRFNDVNYRWIAYDNWTYTRTFEGKRTVLSLLYLGKPFRITSLLVKPCFRCNRWFTTGIPIIIFVSAQFRKFQKIQINTL
jgi:hypothetical protein